MWTFITIIAICALAVFLAHRYRWPLFNAAVRAQRAKAKLQEHTVRIDQHDITYLDSGHGEPLVLIHGFGADKDNWIQIAPLLVTHYRLIIPDLPGFGESTRDPEANYGTEPQLERLREFITTVTPDTKVHLAGNSMGGYLAGLYTAKYPDDVLSQCLLAPAGVAGADPSEFLQRLENGENLLLVDDVAGFNRLVDFVFTKTPYVPAIFKRCMMERNIRERDFNAKIFTELFSDPQALETALAESTVKTQIIWGDEDRILHASGAAVLDKAIGHAETVVMHRMGHCPMIERPAETATLFLKFQGQA